MIKRSIIILLIFTLSIESTRIPCDSSEFQCESRCIPKYKWCDGSCDCSPCNDENFCKENRDHSCYQRSMYKCDNGRCIPRDGKCDGFTSCSDASDEFDCGCEELFAEEDTIDYISVGTNKRNRKCWSIAIPQNKYLNIKFRSFNGGECGTSHVSIKWKNTLFDDEFFIICHGNKSIALRGLETFDDTEIKVYTSTGGSQYYNQPPVYDNQIKFVLDYTVADILCKRSDVFKCTTYSCITLDKVCDGFHDCENGLDELKCERGVFSVEGVNVSRNSALKWLEKQRNGAWGWRENTHRAIIAMYLSNGANFNGTNKDEDLSAKQLELQMSTAILRNGTDFITSTQLSMYINALLVICHDPRHFYGYNLIKSLKRQSETADLFHPLPYLTLCNAKELPTESDVDKLFNIVNAASDHSFITDVQALGVIALSCLTDSSKFSHLKENVTIIIKKFKEQQMENGNFGNIYTTALVVQSLLANGNEEAKDWNLKAAIEFLKDKQNGNGSFGDFLATYLILPILNRKSLIDIGKINCTENLKMPRDGNPVSDIEMKLGDKIFIHYYLYIGDKKDQVHPIILRVPANITVFDVMRLAEEADSKYKFEYEEIMGKKYIYEISGQVNDPEDGKFWLLYRGKSIDSIQLDTQSPDNVTIYEEEHIIMWYKSAKLL